MTVSRTVIERLARACRRWGGELVTLPSLAAFEHLFFQEEYSSAPAASLHGIQWWKKQIYVVEGRADVNAVIHEMGHVFADSVPPKASNEWKFFGWEVALARMVRGYTLWSDCNLYTMGPARGKAGELSGLDWSDLTSIGRREVVRERIRTAKRLGLVTKTGRPVAVR